jgi:hypothetical protein
VPRGLAVTQVPDRFPILDDIGNDHHFLSLGRKNELAFLWGGLIGRTEASTPGDKRRLREFLVTEDDDRVFMPSIEHPSKDAFSRPPDGYSVDLRA